MLFRSVIKFKAEDEINLLKKQLEEKDILIKNQEDKIYELDYVNTSLDEIKEYFAEQLKEYKKKELSDVNERLTDSFKSIAEKDAQINSLSRTIDEYKIKILKLENNVESQNQIMKLEKQVELKNSELSYKSEQIDVLKEQTIPKEEYFNLQSQFESEMNAMNAEIINLREQSIPKQDYVNLQSKLESEINVLNNEIDNLRTQSIPKEEYINLQNKLESELATKTNELKHIKEKSVPKEDFISLQNNLQNQIDVKNNEIAYLREQTIPKEDYINLKNELNRKNDKIKRLEEINNFFNELQEEQEAYETADKVPPFRLEKKQGR